MTATQVVLVAIIAVAVLAALAAFSIASRRTDSDWRADMDGRALRSDRSKVPAMVAAPVEVATVEPPEAPVGRPEPETVHAVEVVRVEEVSPEEAGVTRRQFFNRATLALFGTFSLGLGGSMLAFAWPNLKGGFGTDIDAGTVDEIRTQVFQADGSITPLFRPDARAYIVPITDDELNGSQFVDKSLAAGGFMALFQRCVHLGCRVPWCNTSQGFECPCHGSKYNYTGEYEAGPAPRNLDRFVVELRDDRFIIKTGQIIESPRAPEKSVSYPQGPSCIAIESAGA
jgi:cytochrome b6-f complex iron-sulfur subunit